MKVMPIYGGGFAPKLGIGIEGESRGILFAHSGSEWLRVADLSKYRDLIPEPEKAEEKPEEPKSKKSRRSHRPRMETEGAES